MKIVIAHESIDTEGGVETYLETVTAALGARGHQIGLLYFRGNSSRSALVSAAHFAIGIEGRRLEEALGDLRSWNPDVCYSHNMGVLEVDRGLLAEWPVVKMLHGFFGTCISGLKMHAFPAERVCQRTFGAACLGLYFPRCCGQLSPRALVTGYRWATAQRAMFPRYASILVASRYMRDEVARHGGASSRVEVVPLFSTLKANGPATDGEQDTVLFAGRMTSLKGGHVLIAAAARASRLLERPVRLLMAGDGPQKEDWRQLAASLNVPAEFTGWIRFADRARVYQRGTVVAVPSLWPEPFGLIGLDAAALGKPAVAFDVGGIADWLNDGSNGLLVDPSSGVEGLAKAIAAMLRAPEERGRMGRASLEMSRRMSVVSHVERLERLLQNAAAA
jgi:glycosyltransferase involved in cell wall biosynthesis